MKFLHLDVIILAIFIIHSIANDDDCASVSWTGEDPTAGDIGNGAVEHCPGKLSCARALHPAHSLNGIRVPNGILIPNGAENGNEFHPPACSANLDQDASGLQRNLGKVIDGDVCGVNEYEDGPHEDFNDFVFGSLECCNEENPTTSTCAPDPATLVFNINRYLTAESFGEKVVGKKNWLNPAKLGSSGVDISKDGILDNRHISRGLQWWLCMSGRNGDWVRQQYFQTLINLAWPESAQFNLCCDEPTGKDATTPCEEPDYVFKIDSNFSPPMLAPHFLTPAFGHEQQELLTAAFITKINTHGIVLEMQLVGNWDRGLAGILNEPYIWPEDWPHELGAAFGNMFLRCIGSDKDHVLCKASAEQERVLGRHPFYHQYPLFTCAGSAVMGGTYPVDDMGKSCFSEDMATNARHDCPTIAAVGPCANVCRRDGNVTFCGVSDPPVEGSGTSNVIWVYLQDPLLP